MKTYILDTSVACAWYLNEKIATAARNWQQRLINNEISIIVPSLHYWEFGNVLRTYVRRGELATNLAYEIYQLHLEAPLKLAEPNNLAVLHRALDYQATMYDAVYIELAFSHKAPLITAERSTTAWVTKMGKLVHAL
ncbi:MAG: type II toxin-antitoxin system VapC family toxin [Deltaproteobacteria bacterium]|nr:type II toxin-antitoxin system VapC family toxin [Deltaproteobacteria bacterium]